MRTLVGCCLVTLMVMGMAKAQESGFMWVFLNTNPNRPELPKEQVDSLQAGHMANIHRLAKEKKLLIAGPFYGGGGIFVFATASIDSAHAWLGTDPAVRAGRFILEVLPYTPWIGSICPVGEVKMTTYAFVRYKGERPSAEANLAFVQSMKDSVVAQGLLGDGSEWLLITRHASPETIVTGDPEVAAGRVTVLPKKLYIARGSFCEE